MNRILQTLATKCQLSPLKDDSVHLWLINMHEPGLSMVTEDSVLSVQEQQRLARLRQPMDQRRYQMSWQLLRILAGCYLDYEPRALEFTRGIRGKPELSQPAEQHFSFNIAHSGDWCLLGFVRHAQIGVDVEQQRPMRDMLALAEKYFTQDENEALQACGSHAEQEQLFFQFWTRKEALLKGLGIGIAGIHDYSIVSDSVTSSNADNQQSTWLIQSINIDSDHPAAVATDQPRSIEKIDISQIF